MTTFADQAAAETAIRDFAPDAVRLTAIESALDNTLHSVVLDRAGGRVLWAYQEPGEDVWTLDIQPAADAFRQLDEALDGVRVRLDAPEHYEHTNTVDVDGDLDAIDELHDVQLAAIVAEDITQQVAAAPDWDAVLYTDAVLNRRIERARRQVARAAALRAYHLSQQLTGQRGDQAALARRLGISPVSLSELLARDAARRDRIREEAAAARSADPEE